MWQKPELQVLGVSLSESIAASGEQQSGLKQETELWIETGNGGNFNQLGLYLCDAHGVVQDTAVSCRTSEAGLRYINSTEKNVVKGCKA